MLMYFVHRVSPTSVTVRVLNYCTKLVKGSGRMT